MIKYVWTILLLLGTMNAFAQPANDNCDGLIDVGVAPACEPIIYNNVDATTSDIGIGNDPTCFNGGLPQRDVWFAFTTSDTIFDYTISVTGIADAGIPSITNPQIALYRGDCVMNGLAELFCVSAPLGEQSVDIDIEGLTPNVTYFIRINDYSSSAAPQSGAFQLCVDEIAPSSTIDEGSSTACSGVLLDSGGEDGDYSQNENHVFTICPTDFHNCLVFDLVFYNVEFDFDFIRIYEGDDTNGNLLAQLSGGGVDYQVQTSSGCLTIEFISDGLTNFEGFQGNWSCTTAECDEFETVAVSPNPTEQEVIDNLTTPQTTISNIVLNCEDGAAGTFQAGDLVDLNMDKGIILTSGLAEFAVGPNADQATGFEQPPFQFDLPFGDPGDEDLNTLSPTDPSLDACVLEFDVFVATNELRFDYIFGSEEYPEFAPPSLGATFNDIFAFLVSGPGITGDPGLNGQENIAVLDNGTPVTINSINTVTNWEYYKDNQISNSLEYDGLIIDEFGMTGKMTARTTVEPCNTYHLKLAIADRGDEGYDSGVFISELKGGTPDVTVNFNSGIDYLLEDCSTIPDELVITLSNPQEDSTSYIITIGGTATLDQDYTLDVPMVITFPPNVTSLSFPITVLPDNEIEVTETIEISLSSDFGCGVVDLSTISVDIQDQLDIEILTGADTVFVCQGGSIDLEVTGAASYFWTPIEIVSEPTSAMTTVTTNVSQYVYVEGTVGTNCTDMDSVFIQIINPQISIEALGTTEICEGDEVALQANNNVNDMGITWTPASNIDDATSATPTVSPTEDTDYIATVSLGGCTTSDTISITVEDFDFPTLIPDTLVCQSYPVQLAEMISPTTTTYAWTPTEGLDDPNVSGPTAVPDMTTIYTLTATSAAGNCIEEASLTVSLIEALVEIQAPDTLEICLGESVDITVNTSTNGVGLEWSPPTGLSSTTATTVTASPEVSTWYYTTLTTDDCMVFDSVYVRVDSLPFNDSISAIPDLEIYCEGDVVTLVSGNIDAASFPDIEFMWSPSTGVLSELTNSNLALTATETITYTRVTSNGACMSSQEYTVEVQPVVELIATPDTTLCPGDMLQLEVTSESEEVGAEDFMWSPEGQGLSCIDCAEPVLTAQAITLTYSVTADIMGCSADDNVTITIAPSPAYQFPQDPVICVGNSITLNLNPNPITTTYQWTSPDDPNFNSMEAAPTVMPSTTTTYTMVATTECETVEDEITIVVIEDATMTVSNDTIICENTSLTLSANGTAPGDYVWTWENETANGNEITITQAAGTVEYTVQYSYGNGCGTLTESVFVTANPFITLDNSALDVTEDLIICDGEAIALTAEGNANGTYTWTWADSVGVNTANGGMISPTQAASDTVTYYVEFTDEEACIISNDSVQVITSPIPDVELMADMILAVEGAPVTLTAISTFNNLTYEWSDGESSVDSVIVNPLDNPTTYMVTVTTEEGCSNTASIDINTEAAEGEVPNVFTPNNDDTNDFFNIVSAAPFEVTEFRVYNRWGQLVYNNETPSTGWDGTFKGNLAPSDVYVYYVIYTINGVEKEDRGDVTLVR